MDQVGVREVRQNLSVYLRRVQRGETFTVTEHGRAVAVLRPVDPPTDALAQLTAVGLLGPPTDTHHLPAPVTAPPGPDLADLVSELRDEGPG